MKTRLSDVKAVNKQDIYIITVRKTKEKTEGIRNKSTNQEAGNAQ